MADPKVLGIVLAGGEGKRLSPLTLDRAKPAVPFGGLYRLIDFALSNLVNAGVLRIAVLTQYKSHSLDRHITTTWRMSSLLANYVTPVPAQQRRAERPEGMGGAQDSAVGGHGCSSMRRRSAVNVRGRRNAAADGPRTRRVLRTGEEHAINLTERGPHDPVRATAEDARAARRVR